MAKTAYQKRLIAAGTIDALDVLEEVGKRLTKIYAYPPILPLVGEEIVTVLAETRAVIGEIMGNDADARTIDGAGAPDSSN